MISLTFVRVGLAALWITMGAAVPQERSQLEDAADAIGQGLDFLVEDQNEDGSWGGFRNSTFTTQFANRGTHRMWQLGTSALATRALLELGTSEQERGAADAGKHRRQFHIWRHSISGTKGYHVVRYMFVEIISFVSLGVISLFWYVRWSCQLCAYS